MKKYSRYISVLLAAFTAGALLLLFPARAVKGASDGLSVCLSVITPSLFPFLILSAFAVKSGLAQSAGKASHFIMTKLFGLPAAALPAVLLGLTAGYPAGVKTAELLYEQAALTKKEAGRLCLFAVNSGAAFCINAAGRMLFGNKETGVLLLISTVTANIITGILIRALFKPEEKIYSARQVSHKPAGICEALTGAVESAIKSTFTLCGWIVLFSTFVEIISGFVSSPVLSGIITCFSEVTAALSFSAKHRSAVLAAFCMGFGGLSVHCQLLPSLNLLGVKYRNFLLSRLFAGLVSAALAFVIGKASGIAVQTDSVSFTEQRLSVSPAAAFALIFMCCVFILNLANREKKCYNSKSTEGSGKIHEAENHWKRHRSEM